jgi:hypothetical protein
MSQPSLQPSPADLDGASRYRFGAIAAEVAIKTQDPQARAEALLGMRPARQNGDDQPFGLWPFRQNIDRRRTGSAPWLPCCGGLLQILAAASSIRGRSRSPNAAL